MNKLFIIFLGMLLLVSGIILAAGVVPTEKVPPKEEDKKDDDLNKKEFDRKLEELRKIIEEAKKARNLELGGGEQPKFPHNPGKEGKWIYYFSPECPKMLEAVDHIDEMIKIVGPNRVEVYLAISVIDILKIQDAGQEKGAEFLFKKFPQTIRFIDKCTAMGISFPVILEVEEFTKYNIVRTPSVVYDDGDGKVYQWQGTAKATRLIEDMKKKGVNVE